MLFASHVRDEPLLASIPVLTSNRAHRAPLPSLARCLHFWIKCISSSRERISHLALFQCCYRLFRECLLGSACCRRTVQEILLHPGRLSLWLRAPTGVHVQARRDRAAISSQRFVLWFGHFIPTVLSAGAVRDSATLGSAL